jgi:hypothetical protein
MADPNIDASPESVSDKLDGEVGGAALSYDEVAMLRKSSIFTLRNGDYPFQEGENTDPSFIDHTNTLAKILTRTWVGPDGHEYDTGDAIFTLLKAALLANPTLNANENPGT